MSDAKPSPMPTPDLAGILGPSARHLTSTPEAQTSASAEAPDASTPQQARSIDAKARTSKGPSTLRAVAKKETYSVPAMPRQYLRPIVVYVPRDLHQLLHAAARERSTTATALTLEAVNATHDRLGDAIIDQQATPAEAKGDLFDIPQARPASQPSVQTTIRVTDAQYQALTELAARLATNRSRMISTAVRLHLS